MSDTPRTKDAFDALARRACGTEYVKAKMEEMERELAAVTKERDEAFGVGICSGWVKKLRADRDAERTARRALVTSLLICIRYADSSADTEQAHAALALAAKLP